MEAIAWNVTTGDQQHRTKRTRRQYDRKKAGGIQKKKQNRDKQGVGSPQTATAGQPPREPWRLGPDWRADSNDGHGHDLVLLLALLGLVHIIGGGPSSHRLKPSSIPFWHGWISLQLFRVNQVVVVVLKLVMVRLISK